MVDSRKNERVDVAEKTLNGTMFVWTILNSVKNVAREREIDLLALFKSQD